MIPPVMQTELPGLPRFIAGKVRDVYELDDMLLLVTTDRISAFDVVMPNSIPDKGRVLTQLSHFWFNYLHSIVKPHEITSINEQIVVTLEEIFGVTVTDELREMLSGRAMLGIKAKAFPIECVVRGYLAGSLWKEYCTVVGPTHGATLHGIALPDGLTECAQLPEPIFTPATKAASGHDMNIGFEEAAQIVGREHAEQLRDISLTLYKAAAERASENGIIIADTKFEFGLHNGEILWIDEALTPDSSRFWDAAIYEPGHAQPSFDKQFLRDWLEQSGWNKEPPAPELPPDIIACTADKYREAYHRLTGKDIERK